MAKILEFLLFLSEILRPHSLRVSKSGRPGQFFFHSHGVTCKARCMPGTLVPDPGSDIIAELVKNDKTQLAVLETCR